VCSPSHPFCNPRFKSHLGAIGKFVQHTMSGTPLVTDCPSWHLHFRSHLAVKHRLGETQHRTAPSKKTSHWPSPVGAVLERVGRRIESQQWPRLRHDLHLLPEVVGIFCRCVVGYIAATASLLRINVVSPTRPILCPWPFLPSISSKNLVSYSGSFFPSWRWLERVCRQGQHPVAFAMPICPNA